MGGKWDGGCIVGGIPNVEGYLTGLLGTLGKRLALGLIEEQNAQPLRFLKPNISLIALGTAVTPPTDSFSLIIQPYPADISDLYSDIAL
jgi:hypothetical protein